MTLPTTEQTCLITGYLCDLAGRARKGIPLVVRNLEQPLTVNGAFVGADLRPRSDGSGRVQFRLLRGARVVIDHPHRSDVKLERVVPDLDAIDLGAWVFPHVVTLRNDGGDYEAVAGALVPLDLVAELSDGTEVTVPGSAPTFDSSDEDLVAGSAEGLRAVAAGSVTVTITALDQSFLPTNQTLDGASIEHLGRPDPVFPDPFDVSVS